MLTQDEIREKLYLMVDEFNKYYRLKNYVMAKACYDKALTVAVFVNLDKKDMYELFLSKADDEKPDYGNGFDQDKANECYRWCIRHNEGTNESKPFRAIKNV